MHLTVSRASKGEREAIKISDVAELFLLSDAKLPFID